VVEGSFRAPTRDGGGGCRRPGRRVDFPTLIVFPCDQMMGRADLLRPLHGATPAWGGPRPEALCDPGNIGREDAHPILMTDMFGGTNFEMYDGPRHLALETIALEAFDEAALAGCLPDMHFAIETWLERHADGTLSRRPHSAGSPSMRSAATSSVSGGARRPKQ
jgi:hypothetical protein